MPNQNKTPQPGKTGEGRRRRRRPRGGSGAKSSQGAAQNTAQQAVKPAAQNAAAHPAQNAPNPAAAAAATRGLPQQKAPCRPELPRLRRLPAMAGAPARRRPSRPNLRAAPAAAARWRKTPACR